jgi:hypothetical protein
MAICELCDLERDFCEHGLADRRESGAKQVRKLLISPTNTAHFPGCPHKDDPDFSQWGALDVENAWTRLGNGEHLAATGGARADRIATRRCDDCVAHGPW